MSQCQVERLERDGWTAAGKQVETMADALRFIRESGEKKWKWWAKSPGNGVSCAVLQCNAHVACTHLVRASRVAMGCFSIFHKGVHTTEPTLKKRKNSILNWEEDTLMRAAVRMNNTPGEVLVELTTRETEKLKNAGEDPLQHKRAEGGLQGARRARIADCIMYPVSKGMYPTCLPIRKHKHVEHHFCIVSCMYSVLYPAWILVTSNCKSEPCNLNVSCLYSKSILMQSYGGPVASVF